MNEPTAPGLFVALGRQAFRRYFQPSRVVIGVMPRSDGRGVNLITLCFNMHCSYKPAMMSFAIWKGSFSHSLIGKADSCVLAVPGESLARATLACGLTSGRDTDKVLEHGLTLVGSEHVSVPGINECIANIELRIVNRVATGDHVTVIGEVLKYGVNESRSERPLLSVGPDHRGYEVLCHHGLHRIAVVARGNEECELVNDADEDRLKQGDR